MKLYEKFTHGDRRTVVKKFRKGDELAGPGGRSTYVLKVDVSMKVTEEYNAVFKKWWIAVYHFEDMVESSPDDEPLWMPIPRAEVREETWFARWFGWLL